jgi:hypothetical protein
MALSAYVQLRKPIYRHIESLGSKFALGGARIVRRIAVESAIARRRRGYFAARRDEDGKADIRSNPDNVDRGSSTWPCAQTVVRGYREVIGKSSWRSFNSLKKVRKFILGVWRDDN